MWMVKVKWFEKEIKIKIKKDIYTSILGWKGVTKKKKKTNIKSFYYRHKNVHFSATSIGPPLVLPVLFCKLAIIPTPNLHHCSQYLREIEITEPENNNKKGRTTLNRIPFENWSDNGSWHNILRCDSIGIILLSIVLYGRVRYPNQEFTFSRALQHVPQCYS